MQISQNPRTDLEFRFPIIVLCSTPNLGSLCWWEYGVIVDNRLWIISVGLIHRQMIRYKCRHGSTSTPNPDVWLAGRGHVTPPGKRKRSERWFIHHIRTPIFGPICIALTAGPSNWSDLSIVTWPRNKRGFKFAQCQGPADCLYPLALVQKRQTRPRPWTIAHFSLIWGCNH